MNRTVAAPDSAEQLSDSQNAFLRLVAIFVLLGCVASAVPYYVLSEATDVQRANIALLERENANLDADIKQIAALESDVKALQQRQNAVESLQAMRNVQVRMMSALVQSTPETVVLTTVKQAAARLTINGVARSNAEVAQFLGNLLAMPEQFARPELVETVASEAAGKASAGRKDLTFSISVDLAHAAQLPGSQLPAVSPPAAKAE